MKTTPKFSRLSYALIAAAVAVMPHVLQTQDADAKTKKRIADMCEKLRMSIYDHCETPKEERNAVIEEIRSLIEMEIWPGFDPWKSRNYESATIRFSEEIQKKLAKKYGKQICFRAYANRQGNIEIEIIVMMKSGNKVRIFLEIQKRPVGTHISDMPKGLVLYVKPRIFTDECREAAYENNPAESEQIYGPIPKHFPFQKVKLAQKTARD